jgi:carbon storage regulator CsrA
VLVLTRKTNQSVAIGDDVVVVIVGIERDRVKLGIVAPPERAIRRSSTAPPSARPRRPAEVPSTT